MLVFTGWTSYSKNFDETGYQVSPDWSLRFSDLHGSWRLHYGRAAAYPGGEILTPEPSTLVLTVPFLLLAYAHRRIGSKISGSVN